MGKFVCTKKMTVDGSYIYPGTYEVEKKGIYFLLKNAQGNNDVNLFLTQEEINSCGYFAE